MALLSHVNICFTLFRPIGALVTKTTYIKATGELVSVSYKGITRTGCQIQSLMIYYPVLSCSIMVLFIAFNLHYTIVKGKRAGSLAKYERRMQLYGVIAPLVFSGMANIVSRSSMYAWYCSCVDPYSGILLFYIPLAIHGAGAMRYLIPVTRHLYKLWRHGQRKSDNKLSTVAVRMIVFSFLYALMIVGASFRRILNGIQYST